MVLFSKLFLYTYVATDAYMFLLLEIDGHNYIHV